MGKDMGQCLYHSDDHRKQHKWQDSSKYMICERVRHNHWDQCEGDLLTSILQHMNWRNAAR
jgi:hypothetical protein